jgi:hypothetical protein
LLIGPNVKFARFNRLAGVACSVLFFHFQDLIMAQGHFQGFSDKGGARGIEGFNGAINFVQQWLVNSHLNGFQLHSPKNVDYYVDYNPYLASMQTTGQDNAEEVGFYQLIRPWHCFIHKAQTVRIW